MNRDTNPGVKFVVVEEGILLEADPKDVRRQDVVLQHSDKDCIHPVIEVAVTITSVLATSHDRFPRRGDTLIMRPYSVDHGGRVVELTEGFSNSWAARVPAGSIAPIFDKDGCAGYADQDRAAMYKGTLPSSGSKGFIEPDITPLPPPSEAQIAARLTGARMRMPGGDFDQVQSILEAQYPGSREAAGQTPKGASDS